MSQRVDPTQAATEEKAGQVVWRALLLGAGLALIGVLLPSRFGRPLEIAAIAIVTAIPLLRVVWLIRRWTNLRDLKYVRWAVLLLLLVAVGPALAFLGN